MRRNAVIFAAVAAAGVGLWWFLRAPAKIDTADAAPRGAEATASAEPQPGSERAEPAAAESARGGQDEALRVEDGGAPVASAQQPHDNGTPLAALREADEDPVPEHTLTPAQRDSRVQAACRKYEAGELVQARAELNRLLHDELSPGDQAEVRRWLEKAAEETVFSTRRLESDPLVGAYKVESGDALVRIAKDYEVPHEVLMRINNIRRPEALRAGETIKVLNGPFHAKIHKSQFRLDVYLQDTYVRSFPVGIGGEHGTPEGTWRVKNRLENPTYYPSASAEEKRIIPAGDPENPLGERWIGLEGIDGAAVGEVGYGIHGTIEPQSIGKAASLGCIRMHNDDVAFLYTLMLPGKSTVTILP